MKEIIEAYRQFPIWFKRTQWHNIYYVQQDDFTQFPPFEDESFLFKVKVFDTSIVVKLTFQRFLNIYKKNNGDISIVYDTLAHKIKNEFYVELYKMFENFVGDISNE